MIMEKTGFSRKGGAAGGTPSLPIRNGNSDGAVVKSKESKTGAVAKITSFAGWDNKKPSRQIKTSEDKSPLKRGVVGRFSLKNVRLINRESTPPRRKTETIVEIHSEEETLSSGTPSEVKHRDMLSTLKRGGLKRLSMIGVLGKSPSNKKNSEEEFAVQFMNNSISDEAGSPEAKSSDQWSPLKKGGFGRFSFRDALKKIPVFNHNHLDKVMESAPEPDLPAHSFSVETFQEYLEQRRLSQASRLLINEQQRLYDSNSETTQEEKDELDQRYKQLAEIIFKVAKNAVTLSKEDLLGLRSAVSAIGQEEKQDELYLEEKNKNPKIQTTRPKEWRKKHDNILKEATKARMENLRDVPGDEQLSSCFQRNLFRMGMRIKEDLISVVDNVKDCYPASYDICNFYARLYHKEFSLYVQHQITTDLDSEDCTYLLCWLCNYYPNDVLKDKKLERHINQLSLKSLIPDERLHYLEKEFIAARKECIKGSLPSTLDVYLKRWNSEDFPQQSNGYYKTSMADDVIQCFNTTAQTGKKISENLFRKVMPIVLEEFEPFLERYQNFVKDFISGKEKRENRTSVIVVNVSCCEVFREYIEDQKEFFKTESKEKCLTILRNMETSGVQYLFHVFQNALKPSYKGLVTQEWMDNSSSIIENLLSIADKQMQEFRKMKPGCFQKLVGKLHSSVITEYSRRIMKRKIKLKSKEQQVSVANQICAESKKIEQLFSKYHSKEDWLHPILPKVAEILRLQDASSIQLEIATMVRDYPDIREDHISALLDMKVNLSPKDVKKILKVLKEREPESQDSPIKSKDFFSEVQVAQSRKGKWLPKTLGKFPIQTKR
ncbi:tumor necrosis factor alpha-induced protein 2-like [Polypterus senegalus]|uniref:tumor necrosis factor alpha-induced protein 2-like n=1 Tax=Polypterus senegalus TaxID=55291 RepID=UPI001966C188|nr:tumor necrosis factor alpha-induced protein 2-like [Polypterus senegalus]XP_039596914.1 tumor necrosis factor alpha-induced protein 2-like [Polypterus senegalus]XP_039596915.1 tumor necrosis factor alpha-induced protein 2-like [Polypterus senegalus]